MRFRTQIAVIRPQQEGIATYKHDGMVVLAGAAGVHRIGANNDRVREILVESLHDKRLCLETESAKRIGGDRRMG